MKRVAEHELKARLREVWMRTRSIIEERISVLENAVSALQSAPLSADQRESGISAAHKLAGSLGMFGLNDSSEFARTIENALALESPDPQAVAQLLARLRAAVRDHKLAMEA